MTDLPTTTPITTAAAQPPHRPRRPRPTRALCFITLATALLIMPAAPAQAAPDRSASPTSASSPTTTTTPPSASPADHPDARLPLEAYVARRVDKIYDQLEEDQDFDAAARSTLILFDQVVAWAPASRAPAFRDVSLAMRLILQLQQVNADQRMQLFRYLRQNPQLAAALAFTIRFGQENPAPIYDLLNQLRLQHADILDRYANLTAAICVVHDRQIVRRINENTVRAPNPVELFEYFVRNERQMTFGLRQVPPELLVFVVDAAASIHELEWALRQHRGDANIGAQFFQIKYDYDHYRKGTPKKVTQQGYNLPNIRRFGGVCADQAHYAVTAGKAIGVPTAYTVARGANVGHAWVGFFQQRGRSAEWNFNTGRYPEFQGLRGVVEDPQTNAPVPDSYVALQAEMIGTTPEDRQQSIALVDAAVRLLGIRQRTLELADKRANHPQPSSLDWTPQQLPATRASDRRAEQRQPNISDELELVEAALRKNPANARGWYVVRKLAEDGHMDLPRLRTWAGHLESLCGRTYPDFSASILIPMIQSVEDTTQQNALWERAFTFFQRRADLAAQIRMHQAQMWEQADQPQKAGRCYEDVIQRFANDGPFILGALARTEQLLNDMDQPDKIPTLYRLAWARIRPPQRSAYMDQSNWYQVGSRYLQRLQQAGDERTAQRVQARIERVMGRSSR